MPRMDGFETAELIKGRGRSEDTAVIFLTAAEKEAEQVFRGYAAGAVDYILKPVDPDVLRSKVAVLMELHQKTAALKESEERFRAAFANAPIGIALITPDGHWLQANEALCDMLGRPLPELIETPIYELGPRADHARERKAFESLIERKPRFHQAEQRFLHGDGSVVHALVSVSLAPDADGRPLNFIWQIVDITERRRLETARAERARERAARAEAEAVSDTRRKLQLVTDAALETLELDDMLNALVEQIVEIFGVDTAAILLEAPDEKPSLRVGAARGFGRVDHDLAIRPAGDLLEPISAGLPVILRDTSAAKLLDPLVQQAGVRSLMGVPLVIKGRVAGAIHVGTRKERRFTRKEESLLTLVADRAGLGIEHAQRYGRELGIVETLQRSLLPERLPELPQIEIAARYRPGVGAKVGGDWYDAIPLEGGRLGLAMGDVVGHGIPAASLMGQLRNALRAYALEGHSPGTVLERLDLLMCATEGRPMATLLFLVLDADRSTIRFASAGHLPPLAIAPDGKPKYLDLGDDPPLGTFPGEGYGELDARLDPGSTLLIYTDGLVEQRGVSIDVGLDALKAAAEAPATPDELCESVLASVLGERPAIDDVAVLALRTLLDEPARLKIELPSNPDVLVEVRRSLGSWLGAAGVSPEEADVVQLACHEACSNSVEHAYGYDDAVFVVEAVMENGELALTVSDSGEWRKNPRGKGRGRGFVLMKDLMDSVEVSPGSPGTVVRMRRRLRGGRRAEGGAPGANGAGA
jgi:PAS domain S-box-containing protein